MKISDKLLDHWLLGKANLNESSNQWDVHSIYNADIARENVIANGYIYAVTLSIRNYHGYHEDKLYKCKNLANAYEKFLFECKVTPDYYSKDYTVDVCLLRWESGSEYNEMDGMPLCLYNIYGDPQYNYDDIKKMWKGPGMYTFYRFIKGKYDDLPVSIEIASFNLFLEEYGKSERVKYMNTIESKSTIPSNESLNEDTNWREIKTSLDNNKITTIKSKIDRIVLASCSKIGCIGYFYKKKYKDDCLSLLYSFHTPEDNNSSAIDDYDDKLDKELAKKLRTSLKPLLANILSTIPEVNKVGFVKGYNWGEVLGYIKIPYANLVLDKNNVPTLVRTDNEQDTMEYDSYTSSADYYDELKSFGYDPESDF